MDLLTKKRHTLAHLLAAAVEDIYTDAKFTIGPATDDGFYYDFEIKESISIDDLEKIENKMRTILKKWDVHTHKTISEKDARDLFKNNKYKLELIDEIIEKEEELTVVTFGGFTDLCEGGHIEDAKDIDPKSFILARVASAYWRGDESNTSLTRIYGYAFETKEELDNFLSLREEAKKRDHRKVGKELGLFIFKDLVGSGLPLFTPKGTAMRNAIIEKINSIQSKYGYSQVWIPHLAKSELYKMSGHWDKYEENLFKVIGHYDDNLVLKAMNCPHHAQLYAGEQRSYKDLPIRLAETTTVYRDEKPGELLGLSRVLSITQDDGHVFCTDEQVEKELDNIVSIIKEFYSSLGMFDGVCNVSISVRDKKDKKKYLGDDEIWNATEKQLVEIVEKHKIPYSYEEGEAAFYGPKIDFNFRDSLQRTQQLATIQLDFNMPKRLKLTYIDKDGSKQTPIMIHRAVAGSLERFISVIIEHFDGMFPLWLAPTQVKIIPIGEDEVDYCRKIMQIFIDKGIRVEIDDTNEKIGKKIFNTRKMKIPYRVVVGKNEMKDNNLTLEGKDYKELLTQEECLEKLLKEIKQ